MLSIKLAHAGDVGSTPETLFTPGNTPTLLLPSFREEGGSNTDREIPPTYLHNQDTLWDNRQRVTAYNERQLPAINNQKQQVIIIISNAWFLCVSHAVHELGSPFLSACPGCLPQSPGSHHWSDRPRDSRGGRQVIRQQEDGGEGGGGEGGRETKSLNSAEIQAPVGLPTM